MERVTSRSRQERHRASKPETAGPSAGSLPCPRRPMIRSRAAGSRAPAAPLRGRFAPPDPAARSQEPAAIRARGHSEARSETVNGPPRNHLRHRGDAGKRTASGPKERSAEPLALPIRARFVPLHGPPDCSPDWCMPCIPGGRFSAVLLQVGGLVLFVPAAGAGFRICRRSVNSLGGRSRNSAPGPFVDGAVAALLSSISWGHRWRRAPGHRTRRAGGWGRLGPARFSCLRGRRGLRGQGRLPGPGGRGAVALAMRSSLEAGGAAPYPCAARPPAWSAAALGG